MRLTPATLSLCTWAALLPSATNAASFPFHQIRGSTRSSVGYELTTLKLPLPELGNPKVSGWSYAGGVQIEPLIIGSTSVILSSSLAGFQLSANLQQSQFGETKTGKFTASTLSVEGSLGAKYLKSFSGVPLSAQLEAFYQKSINGQFGAHIGIINFDEKIQNLSRIGLALSAEFHPRPSFGFWSRASWITGSMTTKSTSEVSIFSTNSNFGSARMSSICAQIGMSWYFLQPTNIGKSATTLKKPAFAPQQSQMQKKAPQNPSLPKETP